MALLIVGKQIKAFADEIARMRPQLDIRFWPDAGNLADIDYALAWAPEPGLLNRLPQLQLIISVGAGVDHLLCDADLPDVPIVRFVDPDLTARMSEYIVLQVLSHHRRMSELREAQQRRLWLELIEPAAADLRVGIMGLGKLGQAAAAALRPFGYQLRGWSRSAKTISGMSCFAGAAEFETFLGQSDILLSLLPLTPATRGIINSALIGKLARDGKLPGPVIINAGRGGLQVEADIMAALRNGRLYAASLDVFESEPLPRSSPLWSHPRVFVTPHNAAVSSATAVARYALSQMDAHGAGRLLVNLVDRQRGY